MPKKDKRLKEYVQGQLDSMAERARTKTPPPPPPRPRTPMPDAKKKKHQDRPEDGSSRLEANQHNRLPQPIRGVANFLNEEKAASQEDYKTLRKLKKNPKY